MIALHPMAESGNLANMTWLDIVVVLAVSLIVFAAVGGRRK